MQPNNQQGSTQPDQDRPVQAQPVVPVTPVSPTPARAVAPSAPSVHSAGLSPVVDPNALRAALTESIPTPAPEPAVGPIEQDPTPTIDQQPTAVPGNTVAVDDNDANEDYSDDDQVDLSDEPVTWVAQEYIHHERGKLWFFLFGLAIIALSAIAIFTQEWIFMALIIVIAIVIIVYVRRPPRELTYSLTDDGMTIDGVLHKFSAFKSFGIIHDGLEFSVMLIPTQRFQPGLSVYFPEEAGEDIVDMLGQRLPMKDLKLDAVDRIVRMLRLQ